MNSSRPSRNSSSTGSSMLATVCSRALLLIAFLGNHHVTDACSCLPPDDPCEAMLYRPVLVRATIHNETEVGNNYYYDAIVKNVYMNSQILVEDGQTIKLRTGVLESLCGDRFNTESDMLLDLDPPSASDGDYFSTNLCRMNSRIDSNGVIERSDYNECFDETLRLKGAVVPKSLPPITPKLTKEERQAAKKIAKEERKAAKKIAREAKQAAKQEARKKLQAENKALKKAQSKDVTTIFEACPRFKPTKKNQCNLPDSVICPYGKCLAEPSIADGVFGTFADKTTCTRKRECTCKRGYFKCRTNDIVRISDPPAPICPKSPQKEVFCLTVYDPVSCNGGSCTYSNECKARSYGWDAEECVRVPFDNICPKSPKKEVACVTVYEPVSCNGGSCTYSNECEATSYGWDATECVPLDDISRVPEDHDIVRIPDPPAPICPKSPKFKWSCIAVHDPVSCNGGSCTYSNECKAREYGWDATECVPFVDISRIPEDHWIGGINICPKSPKEGVSCPKVYAPVSCNDGFCIYSNECEATSYGWDATECVPFVDISRVPEDHDIVRKPDPPAPICPKSPKEGVFCPEIYAPVSCNGGSCTYSNECEATSYGWVAKDCVRVSYDDIVIEETKEVCPYEESVIGGKCNTPGLTCEYGEECCCGECHTSLKCECGNDSTFMCFFMDRCMRPNCPGDLPFVKDEMDPTDSGPVNKDAQEEDEVETTNMFEATNRNVPVGPGGGLHSMMAFKPFVCAESIADATTKCSTMDECKEGNSTEDCWESCVGDMLCSDGLECVEWVQGCTGEVNTPTWHGDGEGPQMNGGPP
eukprot:scaffold149987_cov67-Attheya_sp.AAC.1